MVVATLGEVGVVLATLVDVPTDVGPGMLVEGAGTMMVVVGDVA